MLEICRIFTGVGIDAGKLISALEKNDLTDFEDCLQVKCARDFESDYIVTRNTTDFLVSSVPAIEPQDFIGMIQL